MDADTSNEHETYLAFENAIMLPQDVADLVGKSQRFIDHIGHSGMLSIMISFHFIFS